jgi:hypothetical protein
MFPVYDVAMPFVRLCFSRNAALARDTEPDVRVFAFLNIHVVFAWRILQLDWRVAQVRPSGIDI